MHTVSVVERPRKLTLGKDVPIGGVFRAVNTSAGKPADHPALVNGAVLVKCFGPKFVSLAQPGKTWAAGEDDPSADWEVELLPPGTKIEFTVGPVPKADDDDD